jgi:hypothetical protein
MWYALNYLHVVLSSFAVSVLISRNLKFVKQM